MNAPLAEASSPFLLELHDALSMLDRRARARRLDELPQRIDTVRTGLASLPADGESGLAARLGALIDALSETPDESRRAAWLAYRLRVQPHYEAIVHDLRAEQVDLPSLRPTNYARNAYHVSSSVTGIVALELAPDPRIPMGIALAFAASAWTLEIARRRSAAVNAACMRLFGKTAHPHEAHRINSATWYATALTVLALANQVPAAVIALIVLGLGDPAAAIVGKRFGRVKLMHGRTLEGTLAFALVSAAAAFGFVALLHPALGLGRIALASLGAAVAGALAELTSKRLDDNLTIPLAAFAAACALFAL